MKRTLLLMLLACPYLAFHGHSQAFIAANSDLSETGIPKNKKDVRGQDPVWFSQATALLDREQYSFREEGNATYAINDKNGMSFLIDGANFTASKIRSTANDKGWDIGFQLESIGKTNMQWRVDGSGLRKSNGLEMTCSWSHFAVQYQNGKNGLRQNFIVKDKPAGQTELEVCIRINTTMDFTVTDKGALLCYERDQRKGARLLYDDLAVWDADHKRLPARMQMGEGGVVKILVDDAKAVYPVTVDPLNHTPTWTTSADGLLTDLIPALQIEALYGYTVCGLGDVNGDGFDDVAVSAPAASDIISATTVAGVGRVYVFFGTGSGLPVVADRVLKSNTPTANALFGYSVFGGDVIGDVKNDIIVGAPLEAYDATVQDDNGVGITSETVSAGRVYVFRGDDLAAGPAAPFLNINLDGSGFFTLVSATNNVAIKALYGFSVSATEDMTGDGKGEVLVGAPGYQGVAPLSVKTGGAYVYYSGANLASNTAVVLTAPTSAILGLPVGVSTAGLLFGFSVDGLGDYNQDQNPDIVVGAPAGVDITSILTNNFVGGSAYIFNGNGAGVTTTSSVRLQGAGGLLLLNAGNLFGYCVRGVRDAAGVRNGNVLVGAPTASVLSNVTAGLMLKAGEVDVFLSEASPSATEVPAQIIPSPRASSLLSLLELEIVNVSALFGASIDNMLDANCNATGDIIIGEPLSTRLDLLLGVDAGGGVAYIYDGVVGGLYVTPPVWLLRNTVNFDDLGVNAASLLGWSVAGGRRITGVDVGPWALVGAPGGALDFGFGLLDLGPTLATLLDFAAGDNGLGKAYGFDLSNCAVVLPTTLLSFNAQAQQQKTVLLSWKTTREINSDHYLVQRAGRDNKFETIGNVQAKANDGRENVYSIVDQKPLRGANFYRLIMVDRDGKQVTSMIRKVDIGAGTRFIAMPNPAPDGRFMLKADGDLPSEFSLNVTDQQGRRVYSRAITNNSSQHIPVDLSKLPAGMYYLSISTEDHTETLRLKLR